MQKNVTDLMNEKIEILGVMIDNVSIEEALNLISDYIGSNSAHSVYTPNAEIMLNASRSNEYKGILNSADLLIADGAGVVLSSKILGTPLQAKVPGIDLVNGIFKSGHINPKRLFFFGGKPGVAGLAARNIMKKYTDVSVCGCRNGYFKPDENEAIINEINDSGADILLVALGAPRQEEWIHANQKRLQVKVCIGVGGSLDVFAGKKKLAPDFFRKNGLEWLYVLIKEPRRFRRILRLPVFLIKVAVAALKKKIHKSTVS